MPLRLATGPVTWGVDFADTPANPPWSQVLDEIAESGVGALELGPVGYLPEDPAVLPVELARRDLVAVGSFVFDDFHDPAAADRVLGATERACRAIVAARGTVLVLIDRPGDERTPTAGRGDAAPRLDDARWTAMLDLLARAAAIAREHGLRPTVHPHAGSFLEFADEVDRLVADTDLDLCLDTGHLAYAGDDPGAALRRHAGRLGHVHLKDIAPTVLARVHAERLDFWQAIAAGIFCPLGSGVVDVPAVLGALDAIGYAGHATIEQDRVPGSGRPLDDLRRSLAVLGAAG